LGEIIRAGAAREDIISDARTALENASVRDDAWKLPAEERLGMVLTLVDSLEAERKALAIKVGPLTAAVDKENGAADLVLVREVESLFDKGGRRRNDPLLAVLAPGGAAAYTDGPTDEQPLRMALFAGLLKKVGHKRIAKAETDAAGARVQAAIAPLAAAIDVAKVPVAELALVDTTITRLAKILRIELVGLKQGWKSDGFSEAEIHEVIPDRPSTKKPDNAGGTGVTVPGSTGGVTI